MGALTEYMVWTEEAEGTFDSAKKIKARYPSEAAEIWVHDYEWGVVDFSIAGGKKTMKVCVTPAGEDRVEVFEVKGRTERVYIAKKDKDSQRSFRRRET